VMDDVGVVDKGMIVIEVVDLVVVMMEVVDLVAVVMVDVRVKVVVEDWLMDDLVRFGMYQQSDFDHRS